MQRREIKRGVHRRVVFLDDAGAPINSSLQLSEIERKEFLKLGFGGLRDFLQTADDLASKELAANDLPNDWPRRTRIPGTDFNGWYIPDECEPVALRNSPPNAELAAKLKRDVHLCREYIEHAEFRSKPPPSNT